MLCRVILTDNQKRWLADLKTINLTGLTDMEWHQYNSIDHLLNIGYYYTNECSIHRRFVGMEDWSDQDILNEWVKRYRRYKKTK